jgi:hypothetical protein
MSLFFVRHEVACTSGVSAPKPVSRFALKPRMRWRWRQEGCCRQGVKQRLKPKVTASRRRCPGQREIGRVNANELSLRPRQDKSSQRLYAMITGQDAAPENSGIETPSPRGREGTHPNRFSFTRNVGTPMVSAGNSSRPTVREAQSASGNRKIQEAKATSRKARGRRTRWIGLSGPTERLLTWIW